MMNVIDSSGWLEYLTDGQNADFFATPVADEGNLIMPSICLYEVFKRTLREKGEQRALDAMGSMTIGNIVDLDRNLAVEAARLSTHSKLAMADSIILATARAYGATLWTQDAHFKDVEGVKYVEKKG